LGGWHVGVKFAALDRVGVACGVDEFGKRWDVSSEDERSAVVDVVLDGVGVSGVGAESEGVVGVA